MHIGKRTSAHIRAHGQTHEDSQKSTERVDLPLKSTAASNDVGELTGVSKLGTACVRLWLQRGVEDVAVEGDAQKRLYMCSCMAHAYTCRANGRLHRLINTSMNVMNVLARRTRKSTFACGKASKGAASAQRVAAVEGKGCAEAA